MKHASSRRGLVIVLLVALAGTAFFGLRAVRQFIYWSDPAHHDQTPEGWMTLGYVERSYRLKPRSLGPLLAVAPTEAKHRSLEEIAADEGIPLPELLSRLETVLETAR